MFTPTRYEVYKFDFLFLLENKFNVNCDYKDLRQYKISQFDNPLFRQVRLITSEYKKFNKYIFFVSCKGYKGNLEEFEFMISNGIKINGRDFVICERSASMTRQGILSFVSKDIYDELEEAITLGYEVEETVLSKYMAYRGLMFSSCHCVENWTPKIIVVPDYFATIHEQRVKHLCDEEIPFKDKETGKDRVWKQKGIAEGVYDIDINAFDGAGICSFGICEKVAEKVGIKTTPTSLQIRLPFIKGVVHAMDYTSFLLERGVTHITDMWGIKHDVRDEMIIITESMYKGVKYFKVFGDHRDWDMYWERFHKYNHSFGLAKWNFTKEEEPVYTRVNYQILQDLNLEYEDFSSLAEYSAEWVESIIGNNIFYTYCFLGMTYDMHNPMNDYAKAIMKNPAMINEKGVYDYIVNLLKKYIDEFKCGKLWVKSCFKILSPDLVAMMEHIGGIEVKGCLEHDEFFSNNISGVMDGEHLIERNPHICKSEHVIIRAVNSDLIDRWCGHLSNVCMVNIKSITPQRLNGADHDGDLVLVLKDNVMMKGVDRTCSVVIDMEDKATALSEKVTTEGKLALILRTMSSLIGETSNCATTYHNKTSEDPEQRKLYEKYIDVLSIINGKSIDSAKTGLVLNIPRHIAKFSKPLPYFMKFASPYYKKMNKFMRSRSNMNLLAWDIERWQKNFVRFRKLAKFDYKIMIHPGIKVDEEIYKKVETVFFDFCKEIKELGDLSYKSKNFEKYKWWFKHNYPELDKSYFSEWEVDWQIYYNKYKALCQDVCPDQQMLANICVLLCYRDYPNKNKKFLWKVASEGLLLNIRPTTIILPKKDEHGKLEYLGKKYTMRRVLSIG